MRALTEADRRVCEAQAELFAASETLTAQGSAVFVRRFMNSAVARRIDAGAYPFAASTLGALIAEVEAEYGPSVYGSELYSQNELYWIGYVYRAWCCAYGLSSKAVYKQAPARELRALYYPYHTLDVLDAIGRIREAKGIASQADPADVSHGVEVLRRIRVGREAKT